MILVPGGAMVNKGYRVRLTALRDHGAREIVTPLPYRAAYEQFLITSRPRTSGGRIASPISSQKVVDTDRTRS